MPEINKLVSIAITPEQFLDACSPVELMELSTLLYNDRYLGQYRVARFVDGELGNKLIKIK